MFGFHKFSFKYTSKIMNISNRYIHNNPEFNEKINNYIANSLIFLIMYIFNIEIIYKCVKLKFMSKYEQNSKNLNKHK